MTSVLLWHAVVSGVLLAVLTLVVLGQWCALRVRPALRLVQRQAAVGR